jgi:hypothetical protein
MVQKWMTKIDTTHSAGQNVACCIVALKHQRGGFWGQAGPPQLQIPRQVTLTRENKAPAFFFYMQAEQFYFSLK